MLYSDRNLPVDLVISPDIEIAKYILNLLEIPTDGQIVFNGADIKTVSHRLGHADVATTGNIYTHAIKTADERAAEALTDIFSNRAAKNA